MSYSDNQPPVKHEVLFRVDSVNKQQEETKELDKAPQHDDQRDLIANLLQIAVINKMLPKGFRFELLDTVKRQNDNSINARSYAQKRRKVINAENEINEVNSFGGGGSSPSNRQNASRKVPKESKNGVNNESSVVTNNSNDNQRSYQNAQNPIKQRVSQRQKKPTNFEDLGYVEKDIKKQRPTTTIWKEVAGKCEQVILALRKQPGAEIFSQPPHPSHKYYTEIMSNYIDLSIIEKKLKQGDYNSSIQFIQDIRMVWDKAFRFQQEDAEIYQKARELSSFFEQKVKEIENFNTKDLIKQNYLEQNSAVQELKNTTQKYQKELSQKIQKDNPPQQNPSQKKVPPKETIQRQPSLNQGPPQQQVVSQQPPQNNQPNSNNSRNPNNSATPIVDELDKEMPFSERQTLGHNIQFLLTEQLLGIVPIITDDPTGQKEMLEFDLKELSHRKCRELERYVNRCLRENQEKEKQERQAAQQQQQQYQQQQETPQQPRTPQPQIPAGNQQQYQQQPGNNPNIQQNQVNKTSQPQSAPQQPQNLLKPDQMGQHQQVYGDQNLQNANYMVSPMNQHQYLNGLALQQQQQMMMGGGQLIDPNYQLFYQQPNINPPSQQQTPNDPLKKQGSYLADQGQQLAYNQFQGPQANPGAQMINPYQLQYAAFAQQLPDDQFIQQNLTQNLMGGAPYFNNLTLNGLDPYQQNYAQLGGGWGQAPDQLGQNQGNFNG